MTSKSPESTTYKSSTQESETSSGFRQFWRKSEKQSATQNVQFVQQDPSSKKKSNRISRLWRTGSSASTEEGQPSESGRGSAAERRQQVYQAQKRHRNRKEEYVQTLEAEIARLQHLDVMINIEKNALAHQNEAIKNFLTSQSLDVQMDTLNITTSSAPASEELSLLGAATLDIRFDSDIGHERTFLDLGDMSDIVWPSSDASKSGEQHLPRPPTRHAPVKGDSWAALDFILTMEWPCQGHIHHHGINPSAIIPIACDNGGFHGHALTATKGVYESAMAPANGNALPNKARLHPSTLEKWQLPHSEIDKLVKLSEDLRLDEEQLTPAQAYSAIRETLPEDEYLRPVLEALKVPLAGMVQCSGFGAWMPADTFWQQFDSTVQTLHIVRPDLTSSEA